MMKRGSRRHVLLLFLLGLIPVVWIALLIAPVLDQFLPNTIDSGLSELLNSLTTALYHPFRITFCEASANGIGTVKTIVIFVIAYGMGIGIYYSAKRNTRPSEEHGSAKWGDPYSIRRRYADKRFLNNKILTQNVRIGFNAKKHRRNLNVLVCGGSGSGKTRFYCKPNAMNCNTSMVILDPNGKIVLL